MSMNDTIASALSKINNAEKASKKVVVLTPSSKLLKQTLELLNKHNYVGEFVEETDSHGSRITLNLIGEINSIGAIKPRYAVKLEEFEKFEKRFLPAKNFGFLIVSTNKGLMTHKEAKEQKIGGRLIAYCY